jgi:two-component system response regulator
MTTPRILHIEDSESDAQFFDYGIYALDQKVEVDRVMQWAELENYLNGLDSKPVEEFPCLIVMDHDVDGTDSVVIIKQIRANEHLGQVPIIVFSGYDYDHAINEYYRAGASSYILKPMTIDDVVGIVRGIAQYWFTLNRGPKIGK